MLVRSTSVTVASTARMLVRPPGSAAIPYVTVDVEVPDSELPACASTDPVSPR